MNLSQIGRILSQERRKQSKTLEDIARQTCIRLVRLKQVEHGVYDKSLAQVHIQGFIRAYAKVLGLDARQFDLSNSAVHEEKLKLKEVENVDKELNPILTIVNMSFMLAILVFAGLIFWMRMALNQYESRTAQVQELQREAVNSVLTEGRQEALSQKFPLNTLLNNPFWSAAPLKQIERNLSSSGSLKKALKAKEPVEGDKKINQKELKKTSAYFNDKGRI